MKKMYKDIRSIEKWYNSKVDSLTTNEINFCTLESLTPQKIKEAIKDHYYDITDNNLPQEIKQHYINYPHPIKETDADDQRLIYIILFVIDHILTSSIYNKKSFDKESSSVNVSTKALRKLYNDGTYVKHVTDVARAAHILHLASEYVHTPDQKESRKYMIHPKHLCKVDNPLEIVPCTHKGTAKNILKFRKNSNKPKESKPKEPEHNATTNKIILTSLYNIFHLKVDYNAALSVLRNNYRNDLNNSSSTPTPDNNDQEVELMPKINMRYYYGLASLKKVSSDNIMDKYVKFDESGRIHSNLTNFPKAMRKHLYFDGCNEPLMMIDMGNAQPFLLVNLIMKYLSKERGIKITTRKQLERYCNKKGYSDVMKYVKVVENSNFYKECYRLHRGNKLLKDISAKDKEMVREMIYTAVLFGDGKTKWKAAIKLGLAFGRKYHTVMKVINHYRNDDPKNLSDKLQLEESKLFINNILNKLAVSEKKFYVLSLHDGLIFPESYTDNVISKFEKAYAKSGFMFKLKIDDLATGERRIVTINERSN